jgi:hypothetical protein
MTAYKAIAEVQQMMEEVFLVCQSILHSIEATDPLSSVMSFSKDGTT